MSFVEDAGGSVDGEIRLRGESLLEKLEVEMESVRGDSVAMVFQDPMNTLNPVISVGEQIAETIRLH
jgi:peptide/nickel transport system ATP-binding protein